MTKPVVHLKGVKKTYGEGDAAAYALRGIDLEVQRGEFTVMMGPSGSGKTTLLNLIGCLDDPSEGAVSVLGKTTDALSGKERALMRRDHIGFVFQSYNLIPVLTALENAEYILMLRGVPKKKRQKVVLELFEELGIQGLEHRKPLELSGGQQQRVAIARAIAAEPELVLADEPTANVDSETAIALIDLMRRMNREHHVTFIFSTHDPTVMEHAGRIIHLKDGQVAD